MKATWIPATREGAGYYEGDERWREAFEARLTALEALVAEHIGRELCAPIRAEPVPARTATPDQAYTWQPGGWTDQYFAAVDDAL